MHQTQTSEDRTFTTQRTNSAPQLQQLIGDSRHETSRKYQQEKNAIESMTRRLHIDFDQEVLNVRQTCVIISYLPDV